VYKYEEHYFNSMALAFPIPHSLRLTLKLQSVSDNQLNRLESVIHAGDTTSKTFTLAIAIAPMRIEHTVMCLEFCLDQHTFPVVFWNNQLYMDAHKRPQESTMKHALRECGFCY